MQENFKGECWTTIPDNDPAGQHSEAVEAFPFLNVVGGSSREKGLSGARDRITYGGNSGHQAIHLAYNLGASRILLLGYDFGGQGHWFGDHPQPLFSGHNFDMWLTEMAYLAQALAGKGVEVINCSRESAITCFPRKTIAEIDPD